MKLFILFAVIQMTLAFNCKDNKDMPKILCDSSRVIRNAVKMLHDSKEPLVIIPGLEIVRTQTAVAEERSSENSSFLERIAYYLRTHELNVKFADLLDKNEFLSVLNNFDQSANTINGDISNDIAEGRKKDKGYGVIAAMGMMMAKMLGILGIGGVGALAMKALGVSMIALMLSGLIGIKSLTSGHEESHHGHNVHYVQSHDNHSRRRREVYPGLKRKVSQSNHPYTGWM
ncbi:hypothetical protein ACFFRR_006861 [Megaselia abdita]